MRILFVGRGVISTLYGWAFAKAGHEVAFLVRAGTSHELGGEVELDLLDARTKSRGVPLVDRFQARCVEDTSGRGLRPRRPGSQARADALGR
jgi:2-dehydropantoate 2-reductase